MYHQVTLQNPENLHKKNRDISWPASLRCLGCPCWPLQKFSGQLLITTFSTKAGLATTSLANWSHWQSKQVQKEKLKTFQHYAKDNSPEKWLNQHCLMILWFGLQCLVKSWVTESSLDWLPSPERMLWHYHWLSAQIHMHKKRLTQLPTY